MPELPEVEIVRRGLEKILTKKPKIQRIELRRPDLRFPIPAKLLKKLEGQTLLGLQRRGKYLLFETEQGYLLSHLGMTGSWREAPAGDERAHDHVYLHFANELRLAYRDPRRFGIMDFVKRTPDGKPAAHPLLDHLGPEPLDASFAVEAFWQLCRTRKAPVKNILMDASVVVGVGNIYASEALFRAGIRPSRRGDKVTRVEAEHLVSRVKEILQEAILAGGSSISDYVQADGEQGLFQTRFRVYGREKEACVACGQQIRRSVQAGRSTFFCSKCQR